jgi:16S rRNA (cytosine967-C5)-methyltransferase
LEEIPEKADAITRLSITHSHPEWVVSAYLDLLKDLELVEHELSANNVAAAPTLVAWPGSSTQEDFLALGAVATRYSPYGATLDQPPATLEVIRHRKAGIQDEGSQLVAHIFSEVARESSSILDLCAGPGGKAALLAHIARERGQEFYANEISQTRADLVKRVVTPATVWVGDGREIAERGMQFGAILADVPCTGLGALRRRPEVRWRRTLQDLRPLTELQLQLANAAISTLEPGGIFGYATCSPHYAETSAQVKAIMKSNPAIKQISVEPYLPPSLQGAVREDCLSLWTGQHGTDSMFLALFRV